MKLSRFCSNTIILTAMLTGSSGLSDKDDAMRKMVPGSAWQDQDGILIQAHGGGILKHGDTWYWYGEDKRNGYFPSPGVSCYSSKDLVRWKNEGVVCPMWVEDGQSIVPNTPPEFQSATKRPVIERPKVIYNEHTGKFVMWMHLEGRLTDARPHYQFSSAGVAVSDSPVGPFKFVNCLRPTPPALHRQYSDKREADQFKRGSTFRDMNLFKDDDGKAYVLFAAESNYTMHIAALTEDYCNVQQPVKGRTWNRILVQEHREAPAPFKYAGKYYLITSGSTGWTPNEARVSVSDTIMGPYVSLGNPCRGEKAETTFDSQSTCVVAIDPERGLFLFMADRWNRENIGESAYIWLPFTMREGEDPMIEWMDEWSLTYFDHTGSRK